MFAQRERLHDTRRPLIFPTESLMTNLVDLYFSHLIKVDVFPLLHRESFQRSLSEGLHYRDYFFGATVLGVCAIASRYSVSVNPSDDATGGAITPGWEWFSQIYPPTSSFVSPASLHEVQLYCVRLSLPTFSSVQDHPSYSPNTSKEHPLQKPRGPSLELVSVAPSKSVHIVVILIFSSRHLKMNCGNALSGLWSP